MSRSGTGLSDRQPEKSNNQLHTGHVNVSAWSHHRFGFPRQSCYWLSKEAFQMCSVLDVVRWCDRLYTHVVSPSAHIFEVCGNGAIANRVPKIVRAATAPRDRLPFFAISVSRCAVSHCHPPKLDKTRQNLPCWHDAYRVRFSFREIIDSLSWSSVFRRPTLLGGLFFRSPCFRQRPAPLVPSVRSWAK